MITIIHGDDMAKSRSFLTEQKKMIKNYVVLNGEKMSLTDLTQAASGGGLFAEKQTLFIEGLFARKKSQELDAMFAHIKKDDTSSYIIWEPKVLTKTQLNLFKNATIHTFAMPQVLFTFLDSLRPQNGEALVRLFHSLLESQEIEMILFMMIRQFRLLLTVQEKTQTIEEVKRLSPWQKNKLTKQAQYFTQDELRSIYKKLFTVDLGSKTGALNQPLSMAIDIFLLEL